MSPNLEGMRKCSQCLQEKDDTQFRNGKNKTGTFKDAKCKACLKIREAKYYQGHKKEKKDWEKKRREQDLEAFKKKSREAQARYRKNPNNTIHLRYLKSRYGMTLEEYAELFDKQKGLCAICSTPPRETKRGNRLHVDHSHETGKIRGLLCHLCNSLLGNAKDRTDTLKKAIDYLEKEIN